MTFFNFLLLQLLPYRLQPAFVSGFTQYDEDGYPIEEDEWDDDEGEDDDDFFEDDLDLLGDDEELE